MGKMISSLFGDNGAKQAAEAQARAERSRMEAETATQNMKANFATDLKQENIGAVVAGGTADAAVSTNDLLKKKKSASGGMANSLGLNV